jgi:hypothetical protein
MRTTLSIDEDVLAAAKEIAAAERKTLGAVISALAREALQAKRSPHRSRKGIPILAVRPGTPIVSSELVRKLDLELP